MDDSLPASSMTTSTRSLASPPTSVACGRLESCGVGSAGSIELKRHSSPSGSCSEPG